MLLRMLGCSMRVLVEDKRGEAGPSKVNRFYSDTRRLL